MNEHYELCEGSEPLIVSFPHHGFEIPSAIKAKMTAIGQLSVDTDWHVKSVYQFLKTRSVTTLTARWSRYVVDLNRAPDGTKLYPGKIESSICPITTFDQRALYKSVEPNDKERQQRISQYWQPFHWALARQVERLKTKHGYVLLWDAHSIRGVVPSLFSGELPVLNFGTHSGHSTLPGLGQQLADRAKAISSYSAVCNERFKGGYITRHYGEPEKNVHAIQLEINQSSYLQDSTQNSTQYPPRVHVPNCKSLAGIVEQLMDMALTIVKG